MSFLEHSTHGPVSVIGYDGKIYLNHPITLKKDGEKADPNFYLHCMALNREEANDLIGALQAWLSLGEAKKPDDKKYDMRNCTYCGSVGTELFDKWETGRLFCFFCYMNGACADIPNPSNRTNRNDILTAISFVGNAIIQQLRKAK